MPGSFFGSVQWSAPEWLSGSTDEYTSACDVYSYGVLLWEVVTHEEPWKNVPPMRINAMVGVRGERLPIPVNAPAQYAALMRACWQQEPSARPTFTEIVDQHTSKDLQLT